MPKLTRRLGSLTSFRSRTPTNDQVASHFTNFQFDHSKQMAILTDRNPNSIVEKTNASGETRGAYRTMNWNGKPFALNDVMIGGTPDFPGPGPWDGKPDKPKQTRYKKAGSMP